MEVSGDLGYLDPLGCRLCFGVLINKSDKQRRVGQVGFEVMDFAPRFEERESPYEGSINHPNQGAHVRVWHTCTLQPGHRYLSKLRRTQPTTPNTMPKGPKYPNTRYTWLNEFGNVYCVFGFYTRNRHKDFGKILCIWVVGPLGYRSKVSRSRGYSRTMAHVDYWENGASWQGETCSWPVPVSSRLSTSLFAKRERQTEP